MATVALGGLVLAEAVVRPMPSFSLASRRYLRLTHCFVPGIPAQVELVANRPIRRRVAPMAVRGLCLPCSEHRKKSLDSGMQDAEV